MNVSIRIEIFQDGDFYVALSPELNVSSFGKTVEEAKTSIKEAIEIFIEECQETGTLPEILEDSGFIEVNDSWEPKRRLLEEILTFSV